MTLVYTPISRSLLSSGSTRYNILIQNLKKKYICLESARRNNSTEPSMITPCTERPPLNVGAEGGGAAYLYAHWHFTGQQFWGTYLLTGREILLRKFNAASRLVYLSKDGCLHWARPLCNWRMVNMQCTYRPYEASWKHRGRWFCASDQFCKWTDAPALSETSTIACNKCKHASAGRLRD
jgi:hypothetical protein